VGSEDSVVPVPVHARWGDQAGQGGEELEGGEDQQGTTLRGGTRGLIGDVLDARPDGSRARPARGSGGLDAPALELERGACAVAQESLAAGAVVAADADGGVEAEAAGGLPGEHVLHGRLVEEVPAQEEAEHAAAERLLERVQVIGARIAGGVEAHGSVGLLGEEPVEDDEVEVEVGVERGALRGAGRIRRRAGRGRERRDSGCAAGPGWRSGGCGARRR
jgi:hypothetical protein